MTRERKLREVLNVRLDEPLAREIRRLATSHRRSESEVARQLLAYGAEVARRLEAERLMQHYSTHDADQPGRVEIEARFIPYTHEDMARMREQLDSGEARPVSWDDAIP